MRPDRRLRKADRLVHAPGRARCRWRRALVTDLNDGVRAMRVRSRPWVGERLLLRSCHRSVRDFRVGEWCSDEVMVRRRRFRRPLVWVAALVLALVAGIGLYWFQPWKLVTDRAVDETLAAVPEPQSSASLPQASLPQASGSASAPRPAVVRQGEFISHEHDTSGLARVVLKPDGSRALELVGLDTSNGPDLRVWLSDQPVRTGIDGWRVFDDGKWLELGRLKGNKGDQTYAIPAGTNLDQLGSAAIWCKRFSVSFGAAKLAPTA
jgi:hypothetical protein